MDVLVPTYFDRRSVSTALEDLCTNFFWWLLLLTGMVVCKVVTPGLTGSLISSGESPRSRRVTSCGSSDITSGEEVGDSFWQRHQPAAPSVDSEGVFVGKSELIHSPLCCSGGQDCFYFNTYVGCSFWLKLRLVSIVKFLRVVSCTMRRWQQMHRAATAAMICEILLVKVDSK